MATPEELAARYTGRWVISNVRHPDGTDGEWTADPCPPEQQRFNASTVDRLAEQLQRASERGRRG